MKKKWMSRTLALALAGTTVASMVPTVPVNAKEQPITLIQKVETTVMMELLKARHSKHLRR